ncbi:MAG: 50S ribosomal protein L25/general stress protein Ctc [Chitinophagales bacterium]|nr:50S ribosomal protein L25/general stress protein Ctc [Chitinophagales bacterium]
MNSLTLTATKREVLGKKESNLLRRDEQIPCNLYGGEENISFTAPYNDFLNLIYNPDFFTVKITIEGKEYNTIIKEVQFHPVNDRILHIDFLELVPGKKITADIPVELTGLAEGVKAGGKLVQKLRKVKVKVAPEFLVEKITVPVDDLKLGKSVKVRDIVTNNIEIMNAPSIPVASIDIPRALKGAQAEAASGKK